MIGSIKFELFIYIDKLLKNEQGLTARYEVHEYITTLNN